MNISDWLRYLESLPSGLPRTSLFTVKAVATKLDLFAISSKIITVAGTNGKGTTVIFLEAMLRASGFRVGSYISPHLLSYNERIRTNGKNISDQLLCLALAAVREAAGDISLSYFEFTTLAALVFFKRCSFDYLILEVGLGGRLDAVNIFDAVLAIVTTISLDHTQILGDSRELIGYEKAGIMRARGVAIVGNDMPAAVTMEAKRLGVQLYSLGRDFYYDLSPDGKSFDWYHGSDVLRNLPRTNLPTVSASLALMAIYILIGRKNIVEERIRSSLGVARLWGRMQHFVFDNRQVVVDIAHNEEAVALLATRLLEIKRRGRLIAVFAALEDKDIRAMVARVINLIDCWYLGELNIKRRAKVDTIADIIISINCHAEIHRYPSILLSLQRAIVESAEIDTVVVFGSCYTIAEALKLLSK